MISKYEKRNARMKIVNNAVSKKLPGSLNVGFKQATGEYLTWTSDDNMYLPDALKIMIID
ncbi:MAG: glycosyltransferase family A protein [Lachnospiraceae bacterium]|nr:glycosyltransferase family A protein [Lachnospiraceae bacterium]MDY5521440.1 glycosyltransferase family A protein [Agathobacter sp.]